MEKETYTSLKHVVGEDYQKYTGATSIEIRLHKEATLPEMMQEFKRFLYAIGYSKEALDEYIEDEWSIIYAAIAQW